MIQNFKLTLVLLTFGTFFVYSQTKKDSLVVAKQMLKSTQIDPLTPAKASFYSAILPGLGQAYNKKYWKIPIVYTAIGTSLYFYIDSQNKYNNFRDVFKRRLEGFTDDKYPFFDNNRLINTQRFYQRNRDFSALFVVGFYVLNIIDANIDAALIQFNIDDNLSLKPVLYPDAITAKTHLGLTINYQF